MWLAQDFPLSSRSPRLSNLLAPCNPFQMQDDAQFTQSLDSTSSSQLNTGLDVRVVASSLNIRRLREGMNQRNTDDQYFEAMDFETRPNILFMA